MLAAEVMARFTGDAGGLVRAADRSVRSIQQMDNAAKRAGTGISNSMDRAEKSAQKMDSSFGNMSRSILKLGAAVGVMKLVDQAVEGVKSAFIDYNSTLEQTDIGFTTMLGSAEAADKMMRDMQEFAARTPFSFKGLVGATRQLMALGFNAQETLPTLRIVGDSVAAMGGSMEDMGERVIRSLGQMRAKGKVSAEEMMQLAEAGLPAWQYLADAIGKDIPAAMDEAKNRGISSTIAIDAILKGMNRDFGGMMEAQSKTMQGAWSTVLDYIEMTVANATRGIYNRFRDLIIRIGEILSSAEAAEFGEKIARGFTSAVDAIEGTVMPVVRQVFRTMSELVPAIIDVVVKLKPVGVAVAATFVLALDVIERLLSSVETLAKFVNENEAAATALAVAVGALLAVMAAKKVIDFFNAFRTGSRAMLDNVANMARVRVAYSQVERSQVALSGSMAQFANSNTAAINKVNASAGKAGLSFKAMGSNLMGAVGGPAGLAVTAAIAGIGYQLQKSAEDAAEAAQRTQEYKDRLVDLGNIDIESVAFRNTITEQVLASEDLAEVLRELDLRASDFTDAISQGSNAMEAWDNIADMTQVNLRDLARGLADGRIEQEQFRVHWDLIQLAVERAGMTMEEFAGNDHAQQLARMAIEAGATSEQIDRLVENLDEEADAYDEANPAARQMTEEMRRQEREAARLERSNSMLGDTVGSLGTNFQEAQRYIGDAGKEITDFRERIADAMQGAANPFEKYTEEGLTSLNDFNANLQSHLDAIGNWAGNMQTLLAQGLDPSVFRHLLEQGPEAMGRVVEELANSPEQLSDFNERMLEYLRLDGVAADMEAQVSVMEGILDGMSTKQLQFQFGDQVLEVINALPAEIQASLRANDARIQAAFIESLAGALANASEFARLNDIELDVRMNEFEMSHAADQFSRFIANMPNREVLVGADPSDALATITDFLVEVGGTPANVPIEGMDSGARQTAQQFLDYVEDTVGTIDFQGNPEEAERILAEFIGIVNDSEGITHLAAEDNEARVTLGGFMTAVNEAAGTSTIFADRDPADSSLNRYIDSVNDASGTSTIYGNITPGQRRLIEFENRINSSSGSTSIDADTSSGDGELGAFLSRVNSSIARVRIEATLQQGFQTLFPGLRNADGGFYQTVEAYANGGRRSENHTAQIAPAGAWRLWAEPETGGEAYIPLALGKRSASMRILSMVAEEFGFVLAKRMADGGFMPRDLPITTSAYSNDSTGFSQTNYIQVEAQTSASPSDISEDIAWELKKVGSF